MFSEIYEEYDEICGKIYSNLEKLKERVGDFEKDLQDVVKKYAERS